MEQNNSNNIEIATFGAGCFWCVEAIFSNLRGVVSVKSGFMGGHATNPSYRDVCKGNTGHAEVCQISFDNTQISYKQLLEVFWDVHDPTTIDRQGMDIGSQYRSAVFFHNQSQEKLAIEMKEHLTNIKYFSSPIVTEITPASVFYQAEDYHNDYFSRNPNEGYCRMVIKPKVEKFKKLYKDNLK